MVNLEQCAIIIRQICDATEPGKKMVQKLFYLMERKGLQLNLAYSIHFFGPRHRITYFGKYGFNRN